jgi:hypothetical protein
MNEYIFVALLLFGGVGYLLAGVGHFSRRKLSEEKAAALLRVQTLESQQAHTIDSQKKKTKPQKDREPHSGASDEIRTARKEIAHLKEQVQALRQEERAFGQRLKETVASKDNEIFKLKADLEQVIQDLKAAEKHASQRHHNQPDEISKSAASEAQQVMSDLKKRLAAAERSLKSETETNERLRKECAHLQGDLKKWTAAAADADGKALDPVLFRRWKSRALTARQMYQMMRQLRDMSDLKLATYQDSVQRLASFVLKSTGHETPTLQPGEVKSDRYLAAALDALSELPATAQPPQTRPSPSGDTPSALSSSPHSASSEPMQSTSAS